MMIEKNIGRYLALAEDSLLNAVRKISENKSGVVFAISDSGVLEGVLTDGDFRRWIVQQGNIDLQAPVRAAMNTSFVACSDDESAESVAAKFSDRIRILPIRDRHGRITAIATRQAAALRIGKFSIGDGSPVFIIAEIGNNHNGSEELARRLVDEAIAAGADCVKFQHRHMQTLYTNAGNADNPSEDLGAQYTLDLLARFQLPEKQLFDVFDYCRKRGIQPLCTAWDEASLASLEGYGMEGYKFASADLTNHDLLQAAAGTRKPLICSTGMSTEAEIAESVRLLRGASAQYALLHCNSTYPAPFKDINLNYMERLRSLGDCPVGYSGHERGTSVAIAAVAKGARIIEKHFTLDRNLEGNDHRVSLLPDELRGMVQAIREVEQAMGAPDARRVTQGELMNREVLGKSLVAARDIEVGELLAEDMLEVRSPGRGLSPNRKRELLGKPSRRALRKGNAFYLSDVVEGRNEPRRYRFRRPFGVPIRYHDFATLKDASNLNLVEFHFSYKDLELDPANFVSAEPELGFVVHSPELFAGDHVMDLCSADAVYRKRSIEELQRVVDLTRTLKTYFPKTTRTMIVINPGGFTMDAAMPRGARAGLYALIAESLAQVDQVGVEILPQTMPPFPWHFGGQRFHNLFIEPDEIAEFCREYRYRVCLDLSHSKLACNHSRTSFKEFLESVGPFSAHLHVVDALGADGEGLQIGEGDIDFAMAAEVLDRVAPQASFIPEIWQGHKNGGAGFWQALDRLEKWF